ncbi:MAG: aldehyde:ferredoxin oxidoreductase [Planctomycetes bacterium]|nr:aldehyde:ferredoxin oxidoreductase [Planctomycetota bacterium]
MSGQGNGAARAPSDFEIQQFRVDLTTGATSRHVVRCEDYEDAFGGIARGFKLLEDHPVDDAYDPAALLILNLGILSGTEFMTGLRTYFHAYSPLKSSKAGKPSAMWSAGSGKFGTKLRYLDVGEILFTGRADGPVILRIFREDEDGPTAFEFLDGSDLLGLRTNQKIQTLHSIYPEAHFAVLGPAGENYQHVRYAAIALSTENQLHSGDQKARWCGRGGMGGVMGSKNLIAIVADTVDRPGPKAPPVLKKLNTEVARGKGSARFRDKRKANGGGGTWANYEALNPVHALPEMNFNPTGTRVSLPLYRDNVETGPYVVKDESCFRCGISCHKNVYDKGENGKPGAFRAKLDFEPLNLLASNIGIFDVDRACVLVELGDELGMDSISLGTTLSYAMEYNRRHPEATIAGGLSYGDYEAAHDAIEKIGTGQLPELGQGTLRLSQQLGEPGYAMQSKGMEYPAYLPQTNPGYPWALAGGHMSMRTYLLVLYERETDMDYWVHAITNRGLSILRDDFLGACKFCGLPDEMMAEAVEGLTGLECSVDVLKRTIRRTFLRGYRLERRQGFTDEDYVMPSEAHKEYPKIQLPYFNTPEFFAELKERVTARLEEMLAEEGLV